MKNYKRCLRILLSRYMFVVVIIKIVKQCISIINCTNGNNENSTKDYVIGKSYRKHWRWNKRKSCSEI